MPEDKHTEERDLLIESMVILERGEGRRELGKLKVVKKRRGTLKAQTQSLLGTPPSLAYKEPIQASLL